MVTILAFAVLGGGAACASGQLPKNSVGAKQLKRNAVTAAKVEKPGFGRALFHFRSQPK